MSAATRRLKQELHALESDARSLEREIRFYSSHAIAERSRYNAGAATEFWAKYYETALATAKASFEKTQHAIANIKLKLTKQKRGWYWK